MYSSPMLARRPFPTEVPMESGSPPYNSLNRSDMMRTHEDSSAVKPAFMFGNKRRSIAANPPQSFSSPSTGPSAPSQDIFSSPSTGILKDNSIVGSGKSVHWSPALVQERSAAASPAPAFKTHTPQTYASPSIGGPPLRTLREDVEPVRKMARRSLSVPIGGGPLAAASPSPLTFNNNNNSMTASPAMSVEDSVVCWVTVFGFPPEYASNVLKFFSKHGEIVEHKVPSRGNWIHIRYSFGDHARQALARNGAILDGFVRIGVAPCTDKSVVGDGNVQCMNSSQLTAGGRMGSALTNSRIPEETYADDVMDSINLTNTENQASADMSLNSSRISMSSRGGMRPLAASYERKERGAQAVKEDSIMGKLWSAVGF